MRKILFVWVVVAFVFTACEEYHSLPEPELPIEYIEFERAEYDDSGDSVTISLFFDGGFAYAAIYQYYNMGGGAFSMASYLKKSGLGLFSTELESQPKRIVMYFSEGNAPPETLWFNTTEPLYLGSHRYTAYGKLFIAAKGFIKTEQLKVDVVP